MYQGIIIKKTDFREADRIYTIYSQDLGKIKILAKGVRKINAKLRAPLEIVNYIEFRFVSGKNFRIITDVELISDFPGIKISLQKLKAGYYIVYLIDEFIKGEERDRGVWELLLDSLINLEKLKTEDPLTYKLFLRHFELNFFQGLGFKPQLYNCVICQEKLKPEKLYFSPKEGGLICRNCFRGGKNLIEVTPEIIKILRFLLEKDWQCVRKLKLSFQDGKDLDRISKKFIEYID